MSRFPLQPLHAREGVCLVNFRRRTLKEIIRDSKPTLDKLVIGGQLRMPEDLFESECEKCDVPAPSKAIIYDGVGRPLPQPNTRTAKWDFVKRLVDLGSGIAVIATRLFIGLQWREMHTGGVDTHALAEAAKSQADYAKAASESSKSNADATRDIADKSSTQ